MSLAYSNLLDGESYTVRAPQSALLPSSLGQNTGTINGFHAAIRSVSQLTHWSFWTLFWSPNFRQTTSANITQVMQSCKCDIRVIWCQMFGGWNVNTILWLRLLELFDFDYCSRVWQWQYRLIIFRTFQRATHKYEVLADYSEGRLLQRWGKTFGMRTIGTVDHRNTGPQSLKTKNSAQINRHAIETNTLQSNRTA